MDIYLFYHSTVNYSTCNYIHTCNYNTDCVVVAVFLVTNICLTFKEVNKGLKTHCNEDSTGTIEIINPALKVAEERT